MRRRSTGVMDWRRMLATCAALAALLAPACGAGDEDEADDEPADTSATLSQEPVPGLDRPARPPAQPSDRTSPITIRGRLAEPTPGCVTVEAANGPWTLVGEVPDDIPIGAEVEVAGRPAPETETGCGAPALRVRSIRRV